MSLREIQSAPTNPNLTIISRWMHKTLNDWRNTLIENGSDVLIYEEYIDFTTDKEYFDKFMLVLGQHCQNLRNVRLLFSGDKNDTPEDYLVESVLRLPHLKCLSLFDAPYNALEELKNGFNQLAVLKLCGVDENMTIKCLADILGSMEKLHSLVYSYKSPGDQFVAALSNLTNLRALTLLYVPHNELILLKNCNQLEVLNLYNCNGKINPDEFVDVFKSKRNLHTLSINFLEENWHLAKELYKLDAYCPQLTNLTLNRNLDKYGDFINLKYLKFDTDDNYLSQIELDELLRGLISKYADRLQVLDISTSAKHSHSIEITKLKALKAFLCWSWPSNIHKYLSELADLQFFSLEAIDENSSNSETIKNMIEKCSKLKYLRLPSKGIEVDELLVNLPGILHRRGCQPENPFVLSLIGAKPVPEIEDKLKAHHHGNLLQLDWSGKVFASKLKDLIASLRSSEKESGVQDIYQNPSKMAGDRFAPEDQWLSSMNYKIALKSCSNKFNLEYDEMIVNRCRDLSINNADYKLSNMQYAFNFKYDALDKHNE